MKRRAIATALLVALGACRSAAPPAPAGPITDASRLRALREAEVWQPVDTAALDPRVGPPGSRDPATPVECSFVVPHAARAGDTPRFACRLDSGEVLLVKYARGDMPVHGEIFASRLLWLLGFYGDRIDPARVRCRGCPEDPWDFLRSLDPSEPRPPPPAATVHEFDTALLETRFGPPIETRPGQGLAWSAIGSERSADPARARDQRVQREALGLLAAFLAHGDGRPTSQTLACHPDGGEPSRCKHPVVYLGDLGAILGHAGRAATAPAALARWADAPVWSDAASCIPNLADRKPGTRVDAPISEPARAFLAERLGAVSDAQVRALFAVAGFEGLGGEIEGPDGAARAPTVDDWVARFDARRREIADARCPAPAP